MTCLATFHISAALFQGRLWIELFWGDNYKPVTQCECWQCIWTMSHGVLHQYSPGHHDWTQKPTRAIWFISEYLLHRFLSYSGQLNEVTSSRWFLNSTFYGNCWKLDKSTTAFLPVTHGITDIRNAEYTKNSMNALKWDPSGGAAENRRRLARCGSGPTRQSCLMWNRADKGVSRLEGRGWCQYRSGWKQQKRNRWQSRIE